MEEACVYSLGELGQVCSPIEKVELGPGYTGQQRAWHRLRAHLTASLLTGAPGSVLSVSMFLALMMELDLGRFGGGGPRMGLLRFPRMGRAVEPSLSALSLPPPLPQVTPPTRNRQRRVPSPPPLPRPLPQVSPPDPGQAAEGALTKHPPAALAQDAGQVLLALGALVPVWDNHRARGGRPGHGWARGTEREAGSVAFACTRVPPWSAPPPGGWGDRGAPASYCSD